jgi:hypothetical protein
VPSNSPIEYLDGVQWLIETKGCEDADVARKDERAESGARMSPINLHDRFAYRFRAYAKGSLSLPFDKLRAGRLRRRLRAGKLRRMAAWCVTFLYVLSPRRVKEHTKRKNLRDA